MTIFDIAICLVLAYGVFRGLMNGFFVELASLLSLALGILAAIYFSDFAASLISKSVSWDPATIRICAFVATFLAVVIAVSVFAKFLTTLVSFAGLGIINSIFGAFFGLIKMVLIVGVCLNMFARLNAGQALAKHDTLKKSKLYEPVKSTAAWIFPSIEKGFAKARNAI